MAPMNTATYRKKNAAEIEKLEKQGRVIDVCHIIAKSNGGANDSENYILGSRHFNRATGNQWDKLMMYLVSQNSGIQSVRDAIRVSPGSGYKASDAQRLVKEGKQQFKQFHHNYHSDSTDGGKIVPESATRMIKTGGATPVYESATRMTGATPVYSDEIDGARIYDDDYAEWVVKIWSSGAAEAPVS